VHNYKNHQVWQEPVQKVCKGTPGSHSWTGQLDLLALITVKITTRKKTPKAVAFNIAA